MGISMDRADLAALLHAAKAEGWLGPDVPPDDLAGRLLNLGVRALSPDRVVVPRVALSWAVARAEDSLCKQPRIYPESVEQLKVLKAALEAR